MSLYIEVDDVAAVLLADGWHRVKDSSFDLDAYEFQHLNTFLGGAAVCSTGAIWTEADGSIICCPLTAVLAVRSKWPPSHKTAPRSVTRRKGDR